MYIYNNNFDVQQKLTQQCKSTIQSKKKKMKKHKRDGNQNGFGPLNSNSGNKTKK